MSILVDRNTKVVVQGITGTEGTFHTKQCIAYGTNVVAGVTPGKGGQVFDNSIPIFNSVDEAIRQTGANTAFVVVPAPYAAEAILESAASDVGLITCITEKVPVLDMVKVLPYLRKKGVRLVGPNCPGLISPGEKCKIGIMPGRIYKPGAVGVVSRSGTLTYEAVSQLTDLGIGQSSCVGIGGDPLIGTSFVDILKLFNADTETEMVVFIGEIGGTMEQEAADYIKSEFLKPVAAFIAGASAPPGKRMGHAGAIITGTSATAEAKTKALKEAGATIIPSPAEIGNTVSKVISSIQ